MAPMSRAWVPTDMMWFRIRVISPNRAVTFTPQSDKYYRETVMVQVVDYLAEPGIANEKKEEIF